MSTCIAEATSRQQLEEVARFRYSTYVEELRRPQKHADHRRREVLEPLDETARITLAYDDDERVVGTLRTNFGDETDLGKYRRFYQLDDFARYHPHSISLSTKLMVAKAHRSSSLALRLAVDAYRDGLRRQVMLNFIDCNRSLEKFFFKLGYRSYCGRKQHEEYGDVLPMVLYVRDISHLAQVGSPFLRSARQFLDPAPVACCQTQDRLSEVRGAA